MIQCSLAVDVSVGCGRLCPPPLRSFAAVLQEKPTRVGSAGLASTRPSWKERAGYGHPYLLLLLLLLLSCAAAAKAFMALAGFATSRSWVVFALCPGLQVALKEWEALEEQKKQLQVSIMAKLKQERAEQLREKQERKQKVSGKGGGEGKRGGREDGSGGGGVCEGGRNAPTCFQKRSQWAKHQEIWEKG